MGASDLDRPRDAATATSSAATPTGGALRDEIPDREALSEESGDRPGADASGSSRRKRWVALAAVLLAVLGIYSIIAFSVASRVQEMAIRMALGSQRAAIVRLILESGAKLAAVGCVLGLGGALAASGLLRSLLFGVSPFDPMVLTLAVIGILLLAVAASALPALRAASINPMQALRGE